jgi:hypothetical protein
MSELAPCWTVVNTVLDVTRVPQNAGKICDTTRFKDTWKLLQLLAYTSVSLWYALWNQLSNAARHDAPRLEAQPSHPNECCTKAKPVTSGATSRVPISVKGRRRTLGSVNIRCTASHCRGHACAQRYQTQHTDSPTWYATALPNKWLAFAFTFAGIMFPLHARPGWDLHSSVTSVHRTGRQTVKPCNQCGHTFCSC